MRHGLIVYDSWGQLICGLPNEQAAKLCKMIFGYAFEDIDEPSDDEAVNAMFSMIRTKMDEDFEKWECTRASRSEAGKKGNEVRWHSDRKCDTSDRKTSQEVANVAISKSISISNIDKEKDKRESRRFTPPSLQEVSEYVREKGYHVDPQAFIDFYTSKGWKVGNQTMKDWRAAIRTWERREKKTPRGNKFNQFEQNTYDYEELERQLVSN